MTSKARQDDLVASPIGKRPLDRYGSAVGAARMNPDGTFKRVAELLQDYINNDNQNAWQEM